MQPKQFLIAVLLIFFANVSFGQPGAVDSTFGTDGWVVYNDGNPADNDDGFYQMGIQPDGKIIVHGSGGLLRYTTAGQLDPTFGNAGFVDLDFVVRDIAIQADGSILVVSTWEVYKFLGTNGALDESWADGGKATIELFGVHLVYNSIAVDSKGRIVLAGQATFGTAPNIIKTTSVARLLADGSMDTEFNGGGIKNQIFLDNISRQARECEIGENDKIIISVNVGGVFDTEDIIMKYNTDGKLDLTFGGGDGEILTDAKIDRLAVHTNGNIAYSETYIDADQLFLQTFILNPDGSFLNRGIYHQHIGVHGLDFQADGKLVVTSYMAGWLHVWRFTSSGNSDASFGVAGHVDFIPGGRLRPKQIMYFNNRVFVAGLRDAVFGVSEIVHVASGFILALDGTDKRLNCGTLLANDLNLVADAGKCYKTLNNSKYDPAFIPSTATGTVQYQIKQNGIVIEQGTGSINGKNIPVGQSQVIYTHTNITTHSCTFNFTVTDKENPVPKTKNITIQLDAAGAASITAADVDDGSTDGCSIQSMTLSKTSFDCSDVGANPVTFTVKDASGNSSSTTATVTVEDKVAPQAKCKNLTIYLDADGKASITTTQIDNGSSDACGIKSLSLSKTDFDCANKGTNIVTLTATDNNANTSTCTATVTVIDNIAPVITSVTATPANLWPPDRKMKNVTINTLFTDNCPGTTWRITGVVISEGAFADNNDPDWQITGNTTVNLRAEIPKNGTRRVYTITVTCTDAAGNIATSTVDVPVAQSATTVNAKSNPANESAAIETKNSPGFEVVAYPNPGVDHFLLTVNADPKEKTLMQVMDVFGRVIETRNVTANTIVQFGSAYSPGTYIVRVVQGKNHKELKLVKLGY